MKKYKLGEICTIVPGYAFKAADFGKGFNYVIKIKDIMPPYIDILHSEKVETVIDKKYEINVYASLSQRHSAIKNIYITSSTLKSSNNLFITM